MEIGDLVAIVLRIFVILAVVLFVFYTHSLFKKVGKSKNKYLCRTLIVAIDVCIIAITLFPCYIILPSKIEVSAFNDVIDFNQTAKEEYYDFEAEKYGGIIFVGDIESLEKHISTIKKDSINGITFEGNDNGINWLSSPVIAKRDMALLGCRYDVTGAVVLWNDSNVIYVNYWYKAKGLFIHTITFPELFYKESLDLDDMIKDVGNEFNTEESE